MSNAQARHTRKGIHPQWQSLWLRCAVFVCALLFAFCGNLVQAQIQSSGTISGRVTDPSGAAVRKASVVITNDETGVAAVTTTNSSGFYSKNLLKPGTYSIQVTAQGFKVEVRKDLTLQVAQVLEQDFHLQLGKVSETVTVSGGTPVLNTETAGLGNVISHQPIIQLPLNGRNFSQLALLVPGTNAGPVGGVRGTGNGNETQRAGANVVANGARASFNTYLIDGINDNDQLVGTVKVFPNLEDIQEFKVQIGNYNAEFMSGGAVVNVTTKSGTNQIHGSAFEFLRNSATDARQYFDPPNTIPPFKQNQFGASIGGPIRRNKMFYFADYQGLRIGSAFTGILTEPTAAMRKGDFSAYPNTIYDPATYNAVTNSRQPFPNNVIPQQDLDPVAQKLLAVMPLPNLPGVVNNLRVNALQSTSQNQFDIRIDNTISPKDSIFGRYTYGTASVTYPGVPLMLNGKLNPFAFAAPASNTLRNNEDPSQQATLQETHIFSPAVSNHAAFGYTREALNVTTLDAGSNTSQKLGLIGSDSPGQGSGLASLSISGASGYSSSFIPEIVPQNTEEYSDAVTLVHGAHVATIGIDVLHNTFGFLQLNRLNGQLTWSGNYTNNPASRGGAGSGIADFLLGLPSSSQKTTMPFGPPVLTYTEIGAFIQDTWRATNRLTITPGVRYDLFTNPVERKNRQSDFVPGPAGFFGQNNPGATVALAGQSGVAAGILHTPTLDLSPRIGLAYRLGKKTVVRAAYGLFYFDEQGTGSSARLFLNYPDITTVESNCSSTAPCLSTSTGIPDTAGPGVLPSITYMPLSNPTSNVQQWNLTVQRELSSTIAATVSYVGSHGDHLFIALNPNTAYPGPGAIAPRQPYSQFSSVSGWEPISISNYNALQLSVQKRMSHGLFFIGAYTWSRSLDEGAGGNSSKSESRANLQNPRDIHANYGLSDFNFSHRFTFSPVYQLPFGRGRTFLNHSNAVMEAVLGGWQATGILTLESGPPFSLTMATSKANTGTFTRPDQVCNGNLPSSHRTLKAWYNTACYVSPAAYQFGNMGRNTLIGPGLEDLDFGLDKEFPIRGRLGMQFRVEAFNLPNHPNFGIPGTSIGTPGAGVVTSQIMNARELQFATRFHW